MWPWRRSAAARGFCRGGGRGRPRRGLSSSPAPRQRLEPEGGFRVECVASPQRAQEVASDILEAARGAPPAWDAGGPAVALDCEGVRLGRFGRLCTLQLALPGGRLLLFDALRGGVLEALAPLLESEAVTKVIHDCREDSAALFHQHGVLLRAVFDTQAAFGVLERWRGRAPYQCSMGELLRARLGVEDSPDVGAVKAAMLQDAGLWARRPLSSRLVRYALHGVSYLLPARLALLADAAALDGGGAPRAGRRPGSAAEDMANASERAVQYCQLNREFDSAAAMAAIGARLWAMVAARTDAGVFLKINSGRVGLASTPAAIARFAELELGDMVLCCVSGLSLDGSYIYLDRYDHDWDYFDHQLRPSGAPEVGVYGREHRHRTTLLGAAGPDPLLVRGLPAAQALEGGDGLDEWDAEPEDMGLPDAVED